MRYKIILRSLLKFLLFFSGVVAAKGSEPVTPATQASVLISPVIPVSVLPIVVQVPIQETKAPAVIAPDQIPAVAPIVPQITQPVAPVQSVSLPQAPKTQIPPVISTMPVVQPVQVPVAVPTVTPAPVTQPIVPMQPTVLPTPPVAPVSSVVPQPPATIQPVPAPVATPAIAPAATPSPTLPPTAPASPTTVSIPTQEIKDQAVTAPVQVQTVIPTAAPILAPAALEKWAVPETGKIIIGGVFDLSRTNQEISKRFIDGVELAFYEANKSGGINGREIELQVKDDESDPAKALEKVNEIRNFYKTELIMGPIGWYVMTKFVDLVYKGEILSLFPFVTNTDIRRPSVQYVINYMLGAYQEFGAVAHYLIEKVHPQKPAVVYFRDIPDAYMDMLCKNNGIKNYVKITHAATDADFSRQIETIDKEKCDALILFTFPLPAMSLIRQMKERINSMAVAANSGSVGPFFDTFVRGKAKAFIVGRAVPNPALRDYTVDIPDPHVPGGKRRVTLTIVNDFQDLVAKRKEEGIEYESPNDPTRFMAYICGRLLVYILRQIKDVITKEKILGIAESMQHFDLGGLPLSFDLLRHEFADYVWLDIGIERWIPYYVGDVSFPPGFLTPEEEKVKQELEKKYKKDLT